MEPALQVLTALAVLIAFVGLYKRSNPRFLLLPGPKPLPLIGNLLDMPRTLQHLTFDNWTKKYGDVCYADVMGTKFVILGSAKALSYFEKKGAIYSSRMSLPMVSLSGWTGTWSLSAQVYGSEWRVHRRTFEEQFRSSAIVKYQDVQMRQVHGLLKRLLDTPEHFLDHIQHSITAIIMSVAYGIQVKDKDDPYMHIIEEASESIAITGSPGTFMVDLIPWLRYVPEWVPGAGFQKKAAHWRWVLDQMLNRPWDAVKNSMSDGSAVPSVSTALIENLPQGQERTENERIAKNCMCIAIAGGSDTTASAAQCLILAMAMYPEVQKKAQAELDAVIGRERMPSFSDIDSLPYITAIAKECLRWQPVLPIGLPHYSTEDDFYNGRYFIPKGSLIIVNAWSILHDANVYHNPEEFNPDRFMKDGKLNPEIADPTAAFGWGRRICPGQFLANHSLWAIVANVLSVFDITAPIDEAGNSVKLEPTMLNRFLSYPAPFNSIIKPRSLAAETLVRSSEDAAA